MNASAQRDQLRNFTLTVCKVYEHEENRRIREQSSLQKQQMNQRLELCYLSHERASNEGSGGPAQMCRLARVFDARIHKV